MQRLEISDVDSEGALAFDLARVLASLPSEVRAYELWCLKEIEAVGENILRVEEQVRASPDGLCMRWSELASLAETFEEIVNLTLVARGHGSLPTTSGDDLLRIEVIDSTLWAVETDAVSVLAWVRASFTRVSEA